MGDPFPTKWKKRGSELELAALCLVWFCPCSSIMHRFDRANNLDCISKRRRNRSCLSVRRRLAILEQERMKLLAELGESCAQCFLGDAIPCGLLNYSMGKPLKALVKSGGLCDHSSIPLMTISFEDE